MKRCIYKYALEVKDLQYIEMPQGASILCAQMQAGKAHLWAIVTPEYPTTPREIRICSTGLEMPDEMLRYIGTLQLINGALVLHVFEKADAV